MTIARAIRLLLGLAAVSVVVWSFYDVGRRAVASYRDRHERPITLTILHWGDKAEDNIVEQLVQRYEQENSKVHIVRINAGSDFRPKLKTMMAAGTPPDLFYVPPDVLTELAPLKLISPIDSYVDKELAAPGGQAWFNDFFPILIDAFRYDSAKQISGKGPLYGLPKDCSTAVFYVNLDLFEKAGVKVPYDGWTWAEFEDDCRKIKALSDTPEFAGRNIYGGCFDIWPDSLRNLIWTFGGDFFGKNFKDVTLDEPAAQEALEMIVRTRITEQTVFNATGVAKEGGQEFYTGNIGCIGPIGRWKTPRFSDITNFRWDIVPVPYKEKKFQASQLFTVAWSMSSRTKHPDEAFKLMRFLCGGEGAVQQSRLGLAIPSQKSIANSKDFLEPPGIPKFHAQIFLDAMNFAKLQQIPREPEWTRIVNDRIVKSIQLGQVSPLENAKEIENAWLNELASPLRKEQWKPMRWTMVLWITLAAMITVLAAGMAKARREKHGPLDRAQARAGWSFISPWLIGFLALTLGPMIVSLLLSFTKWSAMTTINDAQAVGGANYSQLVRNDPSFRKSLQVTVYFVLLAVPIGQIAALAVALLMNLRIRAITVFRTIYFVPSVVSGVALAVLWLQIFNNDYGLMNKMLRALHLNPPNWFGNDAHFWAMPAFTIMGLWGVGGGMIIYLAGLKGIPASLYEAATIDGAGAVRKFWNVTLPMLSPLIFYNLVMGIIGSFQVFTQAKSMMDGGPNNETLLYVLNLYRQAFEFHNMGYASAMAWVLFVIVLVLTIAIFRGSKSLVYYEGLKA